MILSSDVNLDRTCLDSTGSVDNEIWHEAQSYIPQFPSDTTFNDHGDFRDINQQDMHYFDVFEYDSYEDINNAIDTCV